MGKRRAINSSWQERKREGPRSCFYCNREQLSHPWAMPAFQQQEQKTENSGPCWALSWPRQMHSRLISVIRHLTIVRSSRRAHPLGMGSHINEILVKGPLWLTPLSSTPNPHKDTTFSLYYFFHFKGRFRSRGKMPLQMEVLDYKPKCLPYLTSHSSLLFWLFPASPFAVIAAS